MSLDLNQVHQDMLSKISNKYQKTAGFPAYDFTAAFALAILSLDADISIAEEHTFVDNLTGVDLDEYIKSHRGMFRRYGTYAEAVLRVTAGAGTIRAGDLFSTESGVEFYAISDGTYAVGGTFKVRAYEAGSSGNVEAGAIRYMPVTIAGIGSVTNDAPATGGYDPETDDAFRDRFYDDLQNPNNGSNQQAYVAMALSVPGVGRAKVIPQASGANTVEVCIVDANMEPAGESLIQQAQTYIDPNQNGDGEGAAAIGAVCTVTSATALNVSVSASVTLAEGYTLPVVQASAATAMRNYLREIAFTKGLTYLSYAQISNRLSAVDGILDHTGLLINGSAGNLSVGARQTPVLSEVTLT